MPEQNPDTPDVARLVRGAVAGDRQARERLLEQSARITLAHVDHSQLSGLRMRVGNDGRSVSVLLPGSRAC